MFNLFRHVLNCLNMFNLFISERFLWVLSRAAGEQPEEEVDECRRAEQLTEMRSSLAKFEIGQDTSSQLWDALRCFEHPSLCLWYLRTTSLKSFCGLLSPSISKIWCQQCPRDPCGCTRLTLANIKQCQAKGGFVVGTAMDGTRISASKDL